MRKFVYLNLRFYIFPLYFFTELKENRIHEKEIEIEKKKERQRQRQKEGNGCDKRKVNGIRFHLWINNNSNDNVYWLNNTLNTFRVLFYLINQSLCLLIMRVVI